MPNSVATASRFRELCECRAACSCLGGIAFTGCAIEADELQAKVSSNARGVCVLVPQDRGHRNAGSAARACSAAGFACEALLSVNPEKEGSYKYEAWMRPEFLSSSVTSLTSQLSFHKSALVGESTLLAIWRHSH